MSSSPDINEVRVEGVLEIWALALGNYTIKELLISTQDVFRFSRENVLRME
jgi:hypothetical protein